MSEFRFNEKYLSQVPALQQLVNLGFEYITPEQAMAQRGGQLVNVLLEDTLREQLKRINRIRYKGREHQFSEENIQSAIRKIRNIPYQGLQKTNEAVYDLLTLGVALEQAKVAFWNDLDARNNVKNAIDDYLHDEIKYRHDVPLSVEQMDEIIDKLMRVAKYRSRLE